MTYTPYLIANFASGINKRLQPWLILDDAQEELFDGYVYRGTMSKREGYNYFATGLEGGSTYRESRIIHTLTSVTPTTGVINSSNKNFTFTLTGQISRGSVVVTGSNPAQVLTDNGLGAFTVSSAGTGTIDYIAGIVTVSFTTAPIAASTVLLTYSFMPGNPVMMVANFITATNIKELIVADTKYVNKYNSTLDILVEVPVASGPYMGDRFRFFTWVNYPNAANAPRLLFSNNVDVIQSYDGTNVTNYTYTLTGVSTLTCSWMVEMKDRLLLLRTTEDGIIYPKRIRISGTGANSDVFDSTATGAGFIDIPDATWIQGATFNRDDLLIFTEAATWILKYTGNDTTPFILDKIDESRGNDAAFSAFTYLNRSSAASRRGLIISDGYRVERQDEEIPDFSYNEISGKNFELCFSGVVDADRDHYLIYPPQGQDTSKRILATNYDEDNYSIYRFPLSCMGTYRTAFDITWNDLLKFDNWDQFAAEYSNWNSFAYNSGDPFSIGGGQNGEIWRLSVSESEDNPVRIYGVQVINDQVLQITADFNNFSLNADDPTKGADQIFLTGLIGMDEINNQQFPIVSIQSGNRFRINVRNALTPPLPASSYTTYVSGGTAQRVIPFSSLSKQFNPFIDQDKKVRCGWIYMYVNSTGTSLRRSIAIQSIDQTDPCIVTTQVAHNLGNGEQVSFFGINGMTELNNIFAFVTVLTPTSFELNGIDSTAFTAYIDGGYVSIPEKSKINIEILTNSRANENITQLNNLSEVPYEGNCTNLTFEDGVKKWYKVYINQVGNFIQFRFKNQQAGSNIDIQAMMPGFQPLGRII